MAGSFRIAEGYVEVTADESGYDRTMDRLKAKKNTVDVRVGLDDKDAKTSLDRFTRDRVLKVKVNLDQSALGKFTLTDRKVNVLAELQDSARRLAEAQLDKLTADRTVKIVADLDTRAAAADLALLTRTRSVRVTADADTRAAADDLALLTRARTARITADADTNAAAARLALLTRDRTVHVRASFLGGLPGLGGGGGAAGGIGLLSSRLAKLVALGIGALPTLASLGQSIIAMGPAAALAAPAVLSLGAAFAAIKLGTSGIGNAFKAAFAPATSSANSAASATRRVEDAQRSLAKAQQGVKDAEERAAEARVEAARQIEDAQRSLKSTVQDVADANRRAAEQVEQAERDLADAQRDARQAQQDLTAARKEAAQELEDLNNRLADAQLDQRQAVLDLQDAEQNLAEVKAKGASASQEDVDKAQLAFDKAKQNLQEQQTETARLQQQTADANAAGVEGSKTVTDAKTKISDANTEVADKTRTLQDAEIEQARTAQDGAQKVADAERAVADARAAAAKSATDSARSIADAQASVADAARNLADAQTAGAAATQKTADALAKLAPNAREFVNAVVAQAGAWRALKLDVQNTLFQGLGQKFTAMSQAILPSLTAGLVGTAGVLNTMAKNAADAVTQLGKSGQLRALFDGLNGGLKPLARVPAQFITGLTQLSIAASPAFTRLTTAAGGAADRISQKLADAFKSGRLEDTINGAIDVAKQFGHLLGDIFGTVGNIMKAAAAGGGNALGTLGAVFSELRRITAMPEVQKALTSIFTAINAIAKLFAGTLGAVIQALLPLLAKLAPVITDLATKFGPVLADLATALGEALMPIIDALLPLVSGALTQGLLPILQALTGFFKFLGDHSTLVGAIATGVLAIVTAMKLWELATIAVTTVQAILTTVMDASPIGLIVLALIGLGAALTYAWQHSETFRDIVKGAWATVMGFFQGAWNLLDTYIVKPFQKLYDVLVGHSIIPDLVNAIIGFFTGLWSKTKQIFTDLKNGVVNIWNSLWNTVRDKWNSFWSGLKTAFTGAWKSFRDSVTSLKTSITNTWSSMWNGARDKVTSIFSSINGKITGFKNGMKSAFSSLRDSLGTLWKGIQSKIGDPVKWVVSHVYNNGIRKMWNTIAGKISSKITLPSISLGFNRGGVVPGSGNSDTVPAMLTPGERILSKAQVTQLGGHRGIDALLGQDHPTGTGGNPSRQEERRRYQGGTQHFASGGIVGSITSGIGNAIGSATSWAKDVFVGGLKAAASKALSSLVRPLINRIPGGGVGSLLKGLSNKAVDGMLSWFTKEDKKAKGGPAVQKALAWVKTQNGLPYQWAGNGNPSWDCSGLMSAIESVIRGERPHRRWATGAFVGNSGPSGWVRNLNSPFMIGITNAGVGHTAGTLAGMNVESSGGAGVHMGPSARGYKDSLFTSRWGFAPAAKYDQGGLLADGASMVVKQTKKPERVLSPEQTALFEQLVSSSGGGSITIETINVNGSFDFSKPADARKAADQMVVAMKEALRKFDRERA